MAIQQQETYNAYPDKQRLVDWARERDEKSRCAASAWLIDLYRFAPLRQFIIGACFRLEGGKFFSRTWRDILRIYYEMDIGLYTYGRSLNPGHYAPGCSVGNYGSFGCDTFRVQPPHERLTQHPLLYDPAEGLIPEHLAPSGRANPFTVGHDVYAGNFVTILPGCREIGDGAVVGAGAVIDQDIEPYTIVGGSPLKLIRRRFLDPGVEKMVAESQWYLQTLPVLVENIEVFANPATTALLSRLDLDGSPPLAEHDAELEAMASAPTAASAPPSVEAEDIDPETQAELDKQRAEIDDLLGRG